MSTDQLSQQGYAAAVKRLQSYVEQLTSADKKADQGTLERAADLALVYETKAWKDEVPAPKNAVWRGRPVDPESRNRFATWALQQLGLSPSRTKELFRAHDWIATYGRATSISPSGAWALRPLYRLERIGRKDAVAEVYRRAVELAEGRPPTAAETKQAVRDYMARFTPTQKRTLATKTKAEDLHDKILRDFRSLLEMGYLGTAQKTLNDQLQEFQARKPEEGKS